MGTKKTDVKTGAMNKTDAEVLTERVAELTAELDKTEACRIRYYEQYDAQRRRANELEEECNKLKSQLTNRSHLLEQAEIENANLKGTLEGMDSVLDRYAPGPRNTQRTTTETSEPCCT